MKKIPFNKPYLTLTEFDYIKDAHKRGQLAGDGYYTKKAQQWIEDNLNIQKALLTHSCTGALEMMAMLSNIRIGDEVIMPSFTFPSTANAVVLRGGIPVFIDIREDTKNINENLIESAITVKTKAILVVHYAGVACEMDTIIKIAKKYNLLVLEDAAQGFLSKYKNKYLGSIGDMGAYSFHETKNIISGEGGAILINRQIYSKRSEIIREKGTNRSQFFRGEVNKYSWVDIGSSYLPGEIIAAFLTAQLERAWDINRKRINIWKRYHLGLKELEDSGYIRRPIIPDNCEHNGHLYYITTHSSISRNNLIQFLKKRGILSVFHYVPLHSSPAGMKYGRLTGSMSITNTTSNTLLRLPLYYDITNSNVDMIISEIRSFFKENRII